MALLRARQWPVALLLFALLFAACSGATPQVTPAEGESDISITSITFYHSPA
jgi:hypothetical protein